MIPAFAQAQQGISRTYTSYNHLWTGFEFQQKINEKINVGVDVPYRRQSVGKRSLKIYDHLNYVGFRLWSTLQITDQIRVDLSPFGYFYEIPQTQLAEDLNDYQDEIRFTIRLKHSPENSVVSHRYSFERRYRKDHEQNKWRENRVRYRLRLNKGIHKDYRLISDNEIFINMGKDIAYDIFDSNRFFLGIRKVVSELKITAGYQNSFEQLSSGDAFDLVHALVISFSFRSTLGD